MAEDAESVRVREAGPPRREEGWVPEEGRRVAVRTSTMMWTWLQGMVTVRVSSGGRCSMQGQGRG